MTSVSFQLKSALNITKKKKEKEIKDYYLNIVPSNTKVTFSQLNLLIMSSEACA